MNKSAALNPDDTQDPSDLTGIDPSTSTKIMRKSKKNLKLKEIERVFLKNPSPSGIVAVYMYRKKEPNIVCIMRRQERLNEKRIRKEGTEMAAAASESGTGED